MSVEPRGRIVSFYSYKGGIGRTMSLVNVGWIMANSGLRVLMVDWDLEAPGLHRYLRPFLRDPDLSSTRGVVDLLGAFLAEALTPADRPRDDWYLDFANVSDYAVAVDWPFARGGSLDVLVAGRQDPGYGPAVSSLDWSAFYARFGGGKFLDVVTDRMREAYDYVLIDSRTGISDIAGICTVQLPDDLVMCFALNSRSIEGTAAVASSIVGQRRDSRPEPLRIFPVPSRVEPDSSPRALYMAFQRFRALMPLQFLNDTYWHEVSVPSSRHFALNEIAAAFAEDPFAQELLNPAAFLARYLTGGRVTDPEPVPRAERALVRARYALA